MDFIEVVNKLFLNDIVIGVVTLPFSALGVFLGLLLPLALMFIAYKLAMIGVVKAMSRFAWSDELKMRIQKITRIVLRVLYIVGIIALSGRLLGARTFEYLGIFLNTLRKPLFTAGSTDVSVITLILLVPVFYFSSWAGKAAKAFLDRSVLARLGLDESKRFSVSSLIRYGAMIVALIFGLSIIGINLSALAVLFGFLGLGVGFGLQNVVANFFAGLIIILSRPIKEGDRILVGAYEGNVIHIRILSTVINTLTNETIIIPNNQLVNDSVHNYSYEDRRIIIRNTVGVSYNSNLDHVLEILVNIGIENPFAITDPVPIARVEAFGNSGIDMMLLTWIADTADKQTAVAWANLEIWRQFKAQGIEIPFPQVDLHIKEKPAD